MGAFDPIGALGGGAAGAVIGAKIGAIGGPLGILAGAAIGGLFGKKKKKDKIYIPTFSPEGKKVFKELHKSVLGNLFPENLASRFIGDAKRIEQARRRGSERRFAGAGFRGPENVVGGNVAKGFLGETATRLKGTRPGIRRAGEARREFSLSRLGNLQNIINLESNKPLALAQANLYKKELSQQAGARTGAAIGSAVSLAAISKYMKTGV